MAKFTGFVELFSGQINFAPNSISINTDRLDHGVGMSCDQGNGGLKEVVSLEWLWSCPAIATETLKVDVSPV